MKNMIIILLIMAACSSDETQPPLVRRRAVSLSDGQRQFDLLSEPIAPGAKVVAYAHVTWVGYHDCRMVAGDGVQRAFPDNYLYDDTSGNLTAHGTNTSKVAMRFAAIVTCSTKESGVQATKEFVWPELTEATR